MKYRYEYKTEAEKESIILDNASLYLIGYELLIEGNFLIFSDIELEIPEYIPTPEELLNTEVKTIKVQMAQQDAVIEEILFSIIPSMTMEV